MSDFHVRSDSVDVEQIMDQIRRRVRDKRGVDYTEEQIRELATVRLETFLDPKNLRRTSSSSSARADRPRTRRFPRSRPPTSSRTTPSTTRIAACCARCGGG
jgi:hypothetical protein